MIDQNSDSCRAADRRNILVTLENIEIVLGQKPIRQIGYYRV